MARIGSGSGDNYFAPGSVPFPGLPFTISCWFNSRIANNFPTIVFISDTDANVYYALWLNIDVGQAVEATAHTGGDRSSNSAKSQTYPLNVWNHTAAVFQSATYRQVYLNGIPGTASTTNQNPTPSSLDHFYIGAFRAGSTTYGVFDGGLADVAIWSTSLTGTEIDLLSSGICPLQVRPDRLFAYWPMTGLNYSKEPDILGGHPLILTGAMGVELSQQLLSGYLLRPRFTSKTPAIIRSSSFSSSASASFQAIGQSIAQAAFSAHGDSQASFIRFIPKVIPAPSRITPGATVTLTLHSQGTHWTTVTPILSAEGITFSDLTVISDTTITVTAAASTTPQLSLITDTTTGGACSLLIKRPTAWVPPRHR